MPRTEEKINVINWSKLLLISCMSPFIYFIVMPLGALLANPSEFSMQIKDLFLWGMQRAAVTFLSIFIVLRLLARMRSPLVEISIALLLAINILGLIEANILSAGLPVLDGNFSGYSFGPYTIVNSLFWCGVIAIFLYFRKPICRHAVAICILSLIYAGFATSLPLFSNDPDKQSGNLANVPRETVLSMAAFNRERNTLVFVLDMMHAGVVQQVLSDTPELREKFAGFTNFINNISQHTSTNYSIPALFHGALSDGVHMARHRTAILDSPTSMARHFSAANYAIFIDLGTILRYTNIRTDKPNESRSSLYSIGFLPWHIHDVALFRALPFGFKQNFGRNLGGAEKLPIQSPEAKQIKVSTYREDNLFSYLKTKFDNFQTRPTFHTYYSIGAHYPFRTSGEGKGAPRWDDLEAYTKEVTAVLWSVAGLFDALRAAGLYDCSTIALVSDHGYEYVPANGRNDLNGRHSAMLMIKPHHTTEAYVESNASVSSEFLNIILPAMMDSNAPLEDMLEIIKQQPEIRISRAFSENNIHDFLIDSRQDFTVKTYPKPNPTPKPEKWKLDTWYATVYSDLPHMPESFISGMYSSSIGWGMLPGNEAELHIWLPDYTGAVDISFGFSSTISGTCTVCNITDGHSQSLDVEGGTQNFILQNRQVRGYAVPKDGVLKLRFSLNGEGTYLALSRILLTQSQQ